MRHVFKYRNHICPPIKSVTFFKYLNLNTEYLQNILKSKGSYYYSFKLPKPNGEYRTITPSKGKLKDIQRETKQFIDECIKWPLFINGGVKKRSIITNARQHIGKYMVMNLDVRKCFPSTTPKMVEESLRNIGFENNLSAILADICTYNNELPQGAPTSTNIVNLVLGGIDNKFYPFCKKRKYKYSRFVDDITVSADTDIKSLKGLFSEFITSFGYGISKYSHAKRDKAQIVTGLVVNDKLRPATKFIDELKRDIKNCWPENAGVGMVSDFYGFSINGLKNNLWGRINFVKSVNNKQGRDIRGLMTKINWAVN